MLIDKMDATIALELLHGGVVGIGKWNEWRDNNPNANIPQLLGASFKGAYLSGANLSNMSFSQPFISWNWESDRVEQTSFYGADLSSTNLQGCSLCGSDFRFSNLLNANLYGADLSMCSYAYSYNPYEKMDHYEWRTLLNSANLIKANLQNTNLSGSIFHSTDLTEADLRNAVLQNADLQNATFRNTILNDVDFSGAFLGSTVLAGVDISAAKNLDLIKHYGPSFIDNKSLIKCGGNLSKLFLRGCGFSDWEIETVKLYQPGIKTEHSSILLNDVNHRYNKSSKNYCSVFISYSSADEQFAQKIYSDLQENDVRCWLDLEDMKSGKKINDQIDYAINKQDRFILIISKASMASNWVKSEIIKVREKEINLSQQVLFPIGLVPYEEIREWKLFCADIGEDIAREIREYYIPDFSNWQDKTKYNYALNKLLNSLNKND